MFVWHTNTCIFVGTSINDYILSLTLDKYYSSQNVRILSNRLEMRLNTMTKSVYILVYFECTAKVIFVVLHYLFVLCLSFHLCPVAMSRMTWYFATSIYFFCDIQIMYNKRMYKTDYR